MVKKIIITTVFVALIFAITVFAKSTLAKSCDSCSKNLSASCMQTAVEKRDIALIAAWDKYSAAIKSALETRKTALKSAWAVVDRTDRKKAIQDAWKNFKDERKEAREAFKNERKSAWQQFKKERKSCRNNGDDATAEAVDNSI